MFSKKKKKSASRVDSKPKSNNSGTLNMLGDGTSIEGKIVSQASLRIDGTVNGTIECGSKLFIAADAVVTGDIYCSDAELCGKIIGNIYSKGLVSIKDTADLQGDIFYNNIEIEPGAQLACNLKQGATLEVEKTTEEDSQTA